ncbi:MAG: UDP-N-acetylmuramate--L-alanine ligase [Bacteriovorax sp.]|nr:UDP-N-acetylmuramate--L-alanine ligase [Bacteriovorax sp.]
MFRNNTALENNYVKIHFIGIGGIGMSGIAEVLIASGYSVSGSDVSESANVKKLKKLGAEIYIGHKEENLNNVTVIVYSSAVNDSNPEVVRAKREGIPVIRRAEMLAELMRLKYGLAVAGTHGKTTTTSFLATILQECNLDPTYIIGGIVKNLDGHAKVGKGDFLVAEADESDGTFLLLTPVMSVITNIDNDHMDHYGTEENLFKAFVEFANKIPFYGVVALNAHDDKLVLLKSEMKRPAVTFGIDIPADFIARNVKYGHFATTFDLYYKGELQVGFEINLPGRHNVLNCLGASVLAFHMGLKFKNIAAAANKLEGVGRRFQLLYKEAGFEVVDDYGHHPTEIASTLKIVKDTRPDFKKIVIFEPHRFTRTRDCWDQFLHCFNDADELYLLPIYAASETPIDGITTDRLIEDINRLHPQFARKIESIDDLGQVIESHKNDNTIIMTLGAGSIGKAARKWAGME